MNSSMRRKTKNLSRKRFTFATLGRVEVEFYRRRGEKGSLNFCDARKRFLRDYVKTKP